MIKINQIKLKINHTEEELFRVILQTLRLNESDIKEWSIEKRSIDARKKPNLFYIYSVGVTLQNEKAFIKKLERLKNNQIQQVNIKKYNHIPCGKTNLSNPPVIIGSGPAGLFCAYELALQGYCPILLERGGSVETRQKEVEAFWNTGVLNPESNVQFGEGGAGTFSDGKLNTGVKDPYGRNRRVLETFVEHGAPQEILYDSKPHIGTDILIEVVRNIRNHIIELGGSVRFHAHVTSLQIDNGKVTGVVVNQTESISSEVVVLAIGHSARDTFEYLHSESIPMEAKSFAIGLRIEHLQETINESQYGENYPEELPAAPYKLTANLSSRRGVYSFCMCPGGFVVNASSEEGLLAVNGMSYSKRDSKNANSAIVVTVNPSDYQTSALDTTSALGGMYFQRMLEKKAFQLGNGMIPIQLYGDYCENKSTDAVRSIVPEIKGKYLTTNLRQILPDFIGDSIEEGIRIFGNKIKGFSHPDAVLSGIESRTSSPVRILRNQDFQSDIRGLYPCGEGAGYAGGITSAAIDGIKVFEAISNQYQP